jgi:modulator of FtsH protease HflC
MKRSPLTIAVAAVLILIFGLLLFVYQVRKSEVAVVTLFGNIHTVKSEPGPGLRLPWPIENVHKLDQRVQILDGKYEEAKLSDQNILMLSVYVGYRIDDARAFFPQFVNGSIPEAEKVLGDMVRSARNEVAGQHRFSDFVSTDEKQMKFSQIENEILQKVQKQVRDKHCGIEIKFIQIQKIGLPESVTQNVLDRMSSDRQYYISAIQAQGEKEANEIKALADNTANKLLSDANAKAFIIRGQGEAQMMKSLAVLQENPALATFNMKMTALEEFLKKNATLVLDQTTSPLEWLRMDQSSQAVSTNAIDPK